MSRAAQLVGKTLTPRGVVELINGLRLTGASMKLSDLRDIIAQVDGSRIAGSIGPDLLTNLLTQNITAKLKEAWAKWPTTWQQWVVRDQSDYLDDQVREVVAQIGMIPALSDTGGTFQEIKAPTVSQISFSIEGFGGYMSVDMKTKRSDRLNYFAKLGSRLGRAGISRLHTYIYITMLQANPTYQDGNGHSLFDDTNHHNDYDPTGAGKALTYDNLAAAMAKFADIVDSDGEPLTLGDKVVLICGTKLQEDANQLVKNPEKPGTANREINTLRSRIVGIDVSRKLGNDWYLAPVQDDVEGLVLTFYEGKEEPEITVEPPTSSYQFEHPGNQRWRVDHWYGGSYTYPVVIRGSQNV